MKKRTKFLLFGLIPFSAFIFFVATGYHYIPVERTIGRCMMDYTSPSTYMDRPSPLVSYKFHVEEAEILVCYGSPSARDRKVFGSMVGFDRLWRMGANEPTRFYTTADLVLGEVVVPKGRYSLYAIPHENEWEIFISESTYHWGNVITGGVRKQEIGSFVAETKPTANFVESFKIFSENDTLVLEWENTRVEVPVVSF